MRMSKAKEMKDEQSRLEDTVFKKVLTWKPQITQPKEPKLSSYITKSDH